MTIIALFCNEEHFLIKKTNKKLFFFDIILEAVSRRFSKWFS